MTKITQQFKHCMAEANDFASSCSCEIFYIDNIKTDNTVTVVT